MTLWGSAIECLSWHLKSAMVNVFSYSVVLWFLTLITVLSNTINNYYSLMTTSINIYDNVVIWHARVGHIGQEKMNRLARENLLGQFTKIDRLTFEYYLASKRTRKKIWKGN